ncbi:MAG: hypothetical protein AAGJ18_16505 [Bacteroidota bacterium]
MKSSTEAADLEINGMFWVHLFVTSLAWVGPFLFSWYLMIIAYILVQMQYQVFNRCLMNEGHALGEEDHKTFYHYIFTKMGMTLERRAVKVFVRQRLNYILAAFAIFWQLYLGFQPLLFFSNNLPF